MSSKVYTKAENPQTLTFITAPEKIAKEIRRLYDIVGSKFENQYIAQINSEDEDWKPHVSIYNSSFPSENLDKVLNTISKVAEKTKPVEINLGKITYSNDKQYLFVEVDTSADDSVLKFNKALLNELSSLREGNIKPKYLAMWEEFAEEEKELIKKTGHRYKYTPHLTIAKLDPEEMEDAFQLVKDEDLSKLSFTADEIFFDVEQGDPLEEWKDVGRFKLK